LRERREFDLFIVVNKKNVCCAAVDDKIGRNNLLKCPDSETKYIAQGCSALYSSGQ
jgi:hypothetical protein